MYIICSSLSALFMFGPDGLCDQSRHRGLVRRFVMIFVEARAKVACMRLDHTHVRNGHMSYEPLVKAGITLTQWCSTAEGI